MRGTAAKRMRTLSSALGDAGRCDRSSAADDLRPSDELDRLRYTYDLAGYVVLRGVLSAEKLRRIDAAVDANLAAFHERTGALRTSRRAAFVGDGTTGRLDCGTVLSWPGGHSEVFREMLVEPRVVSLLNMVVGEGYRLDHLPLLIRQRKGAEGFDFHGGAVGPDGAHREEVSYDVRAGAGGRPRIVSRLVNVSFALSDTAAGNGGFVIIPGSHKSNFPLPECLHEAPDMDICRVPELKAGDVIVFSEATAHGALPWAGEVERRTLFYRFSPPGVAYGRGHSAVFPGLEGQLSESQRAVLTPPFAMRLSRPSLEAEDDGSVRTKVGQDRPQLRRDFDVAVYGNEYF